MNYYIILIIKMTILVVDFGSQYTHLIYHKLKYYVGLNVEMIDNDQFNEMDKSELSILYDCVILSGGPDVAGTETWTISELPVRVIGVCYGAQLMAVQNGYNLEKRIGEYGKTKIHDGDLGNILIAWMSHEMFIDQHSNLDGKFIFGQYTIDDNHPVHWYYDDIIDDIKYMRIGFQYHPEVDHTEYGLDILYNAVQDVKGKVPMLANNIDILALELENQIKSLIGINDKIYLALSGGVDSSTLALFLLQYFRPEQLQFYIVDNGLMRKDEVMDVVKVLLTYIPDKCLTVLDKSEYFLEQLENVVEPEHKRKIIGKAFIDVFTEAIELDIKLNPCAGKTWFAQGTIYPDVIESGKTKNSKVIKSHHNVGGLPETLPCELLEPFRNIYKNDIRMIADKFGLPNEIKHRHPFPGPGLSIRILGNISKDKIKIVQDADHIFRLEIKRRNIDSWQIGVILLPIKTVGVKGDNRSYQHVIALRAVDSNNGMTAEPTKIPITDLIEIGNIIQKNVEGINRIVYDLSSKPPATIEWE
jgi:GMP synthase (glutamine-hydrolysing)